MNSSEPQSKALRVVLAGGGTGGHVFPALAVATELRRMRPGIGLLYIGGDRLEARLAPEAGLRFRAISVHGVAGRGLAGWPRRMRAALELALLIPLFQSLRELKRFRPHVVIGTGGYVSGPVLLAARLRRIPSLAVEGNRVAGLTSRAVARLVDVMAVVSTKEAAFFSPCLRRDASVAVTGLPVRTGITDLSREEGASALGLDPSQTTLLILGGSLGSKRINQAAVGAIRLLAGAQGKLEGLQIIHVTGERGPLAFDPGEGAAVAPGYQARSFLAEYPEALAAADVVVCRGGASTLAEVAARGLPSIIIPWSQASTGEQAKNADPFARAGAAVVIPDDELTDERLGAALRALLWDTARREAMARAARLLGRPEAAARVAEIALRLAEGVTDGKRYASGGSGGRSA